MRWRRRSLSSTLEPSVRQKMDRQTNTWMFLVFSWDLLSTTTMENNSCLLFDCCSMTAASSCWRYNMAALLWLVTSCLQLLMDPLYVCTWIYSVVHLSVLWWPLWNCGPWPQLNDLFTVIYKEPISSHCLSLQPLVSTEHSPSPQVPFLHQSQSSSQSTVNSSKSTAKQSEWVTDTEPNKQALSSWKC